MFRSERETAFSRRTFIKTAGAALAGAAGLYALWPDLPSPLRRAATALGSGELSLGAREALYVRQMITAESENSRTIQWQSASPEDAAAVEYRVRGETAVERAAADSGHFSDAGAERYLYTANLTGLRPDTSYEYRVGYGERRGAWQGFATAGSGPFKALLFPDSQSNDYSDWRRVAQAAYAANPDAAFFINMGDLVDNGEDYAQWQAWFASLEGVIDAIPCAPVLGNHETYTLDWKVRMPEAYLRLFSLPANGDAAFRNQYYSFDYGDVHFAVLNTQLEEMLQFQPGLAEAQEAWLLRDMARTRKKWKIILMHKDVLTYEIRNRTGRSAGISDIGRRFMPLFEQCGADVVLTAHLHTYRRRTRLRGFQPDARGLLYIVTGVAGNVRYPDFWIDHPFDEAVAPQPETDNYLTLEASADALRLSVYLPSGERIDTTTVYKR